MESWCLCLLCAFRGQTAAGCVRLVQGRGCEEVGSLYQTRNKRNASRSHKSFSFILSLCILNSQLEGLPAVGW